jgi:hypothetical protein
MSKPKKCRRSRAAMKSGLPKGAYRLPTGGIVMPATSSPGSNLVVRAIRRENPDLKRLARALVDIAIEEEPDETIRRSMQDAIDRSRAKHDRRLPTDRGEHGSRRRES